MFGPAPSTLNGALLTVGDVRAAAEGPPGAGGAPLQEPRRRRPFGEGEGGDGDVLSLGMEGLSDNDSY